MEQEFDNIDLFDQYLNNEFTEKEKTTFEKRLANETDLKADFDFHQSMLGGIEYAGDEDLRQTIAGVQGKLEAANFFKERKEAKVVNMGRRSLYRNLSIAASILLLVGALFYLNTPDHTGFGGQNFAQYYQTESELLPVVLDKLESSGFANPNAEENKSLSIALKAYEDKNFNTALTQLRSFTIDYPNNKTGQLYLGLTLLENKEYQKALEYLLPLNTDTDIQIKNAATWFSALSYSQIGTAKDDAKAKELLKVISVSNSSYASKASQYLNNY